MRVLLAGLGFVGEELARQLDMAGHGVVAIRRTAGEATGFLRVAGDLTDPKTLASLPGAFDALVFLASPDRSDDQAYVLTYQRALDTTLAMLEKRRDPLQRVVLASSTAVYAEQQGGWVDENSPTDATSFRGRRLLDAERAVASAQWPSIAVRFGGLYGPGRTGFLRRVREGKTHLPRHARYSNRIFREDAARALVHLLTLDTPASVYNGVDDDPADLRDVIRFAARQLSVDVPALEAAEATSSRGHKRVSSRRLQASGFQLSFPSFRQGYGFLMGEEPKPDPDQPT